MITAPHQKKKNEKEKEIETVEVVGAYRSPAIMKIRFDGTQCAQASCTPVCVGCAFIAASTVCTPFSSPTFCLISGVAIIRFHSVPHLRARSGEHEPS